MADLLSKINQGVGIKLEIYKLAKRYPKYSVTSSMGTNLAKVQKSCLGKSNELKGHLAQRMKLHLSSTSWKALWKVEMNLHSFRLQQYLVMGFIRTSSVSIAAKKYQQYVLAILALKEGPKLYIKLPIDRLSGCDW